MGRKKKSKIEFRYYRMPEDIPFLALLGEKWVQYYGRDVDYLHFHNYLEIGYCYSGTGTLVLGEENYRFTGNQFSVIPKNYLSRLPICSYMSLHKAVSPHRAVPGPQPRAPFRLFLLSF